MTIKQLVEENIEYVSNLGVSDDWTFDGVMFLYVTRPHHIITAKNKLNTLSYWGKKEGIRLKIGRYKMNFTSIDQEHSTQFIESITTHDPFLNNDFIVEEKIQSLFKKKKRNKSKVMKLYIDGWSVKDISAKLKMSEKMASHYVAFTRKEVNKLLGIDRKVIKTVRYKKGL